MVFPAAFPPLILLDTVIRLLLINYIKRVVMQDGSARETYFSHNPEVVSPLSRARG